MTTPLTASRISSVFGLKASPHIAIFVFLSSQRASESFSTTRRFCRSFTRSAEAIISKLYPNSLPLSMRALTSFGRQLPQYQAQAERKLFPIRESSQSHFATSRISAQTLSEKFAISFMKLIFVARKLLAAYLISSELSRPVKSISVCVRSKGRYISSSTARARDVSYHRTILSGERKSATAVPSLRNSGLEAISYSISCLLLYISRLIISLQSFAVPTGTVDLLINSLYSEIYFPKLFATC